MPLTQSPILLTHRINEFSSGKVLTLMLSAEERTRFRGRRSTSCGCEVILQLPREGSLQPGDVLVGNNKSLFVRVEAALEELNVVRSSSELQLIKAAYHLGNRHVALEIHSHELFFLKDKVLSKMLKAMGYMVDSSVRTFFPELGAYYQANSHKH